MGTPARDAIIEIIVRCCTTARQTLDLNGSSYANIQLTGDTIPALYKRATLARDSLLYMDRVHT